MGRKHKKNWKRSSLAESKYVPFGWKNKNIDAYVTVEREYRDDSLPKYRAYYKTIVSNSGSPILGLSGNNKNQLKAKVIDWLEDHPNGLREPYNIYVGAAQTGKANSEATTFSIKHYRTGHKGGSGGIDEIERDNLDINTLGETPNRIKSSPFGDYVDFTIHNVIDHRIVQGRSNKRFSGTRLIVTLRNNDDKTLKDVVTRGWD